MQSPLTISITSSSTKLKQSFPTDPKADIQIVHKSKQYKLQKAFLRLYSKYFEKCLTADRAILEIKEQFDERCFEVMLRCFYGEGITVRDRTQVIEYYKIAQFLQIDCVLHLLRNDMTQHSKEYKLFQLLNLAYKYSDQNIFQKCLHQLEADNYMQLKNETQRKQFLNVSQQLFKFVIKSHNRLPKQRKSLNPFQLLQLITQFCKTHSLQADLRNSLKFELIQKNTLTSLQYKKIFLDEQEPKRHIHRAFSMVPSNTAHGFGVEHQFQKFNINHSVNLSMVNRRIQLEMDTNFLRKKNKQLLDQKQNLWKEVKTLSEISRNQLLKSQDINQQFNKFRKKFSQSDNSQEPLEKKLKKISSQFVNFQKSMSDSHSKLQRLLQSTKALVEKNSIKEPKDEQVQQKERMQISHVSSQSSFWKGQHDKSPKINSFTTLTVQKKKQKSKDKDKDRKQKGRQTSFVRSQYQNQKSKSNISNAPSNSNKSKISKQSYHKQTRIQFQTQSKILKTPKQLQSLAQILSTQRFVKKRLKLLYQLSKAQSPLSSPTKSPKSPPSKAKTSRNYQQMIHKLKNQLEYKENVLYLFRTNFGKLVGGFVSIGINFDDVGDHCDGNAFIFSVTQNRKFMVKQQLRSQAITIQKDYIICFGTDLLISDQLFQLKNYCQWPSIYHQSQQLQAKNKILQTSRSKHQNQGQAYNKNAQQQQIEQQYYDEDHVDDHKEIYAKWLVGSELFEIVEMECYEVEDMGTDMVL